MGSEDDALRLEMREHYAACARAYTAFQASRGLSENTPRDGFVCGARRIGDAWLVFVLAPDYFESGATAAVAIIDFKSAETVLGFNPSFDWSAIRPSPTVAARDAAHGNWERISLKARAATIQLTNDGATFGEIVEREQSR